MRSGYSFSTRLSCWVLAPQFWPPRPENIDVQLELSVKTSDYVEGVSHFLEKRAANFPDLDPDRG